MDVTSGVQTDILNFGAGRLEFHVKEKNLQFDLAIVLKLSQNNCSTAAEQLVLQLLNHTQITETDEVNKVVSDF